MKTIKVLQVFTILDRGGAETNLMNYYRNIDQSKIHFDFLVHRVEEGAYEQEIKNLGGRIYRLPALHPLQLKSYKAAVEKFFDEHHDYQIIHGQCSELGIYIYQEAKKRNVPVIIAHAHNSKMDWDQKAIFRIWWKFRMQSFINTYFTCGHESANWLFGPYLANKSYQMNNAVNLKEFCYQPVMREEKRQKLNAQNTVNFIHVGRFNVQKNHLFLLDVFSEIIKLQRNSRLFLIGNGELQFDVKKRIQKLNLDENVELLGIRVDIADLFHAADVFVFPSLFEGFPVSLVEAQASGILCAISDKIPEESILLPDNVLVLSLNESAATWAKKITIKQKGYARADESLNIKNLGYDIKSNALKLEQKYIELVNRFS